MGDRQVSKPGFGIDVTGSDWRGAVILTEILER